MFRKTPAATSQFFFSSTGFFVGCKACARQSSRAPNPAFVGVHLESKPLDSYVLASIWRPNRVDSSLLFSVRAVCKLLIFFAWGARGPGFKSRRPDQPF